MGSDMHTSSSMTNTTIATTAPAVRTVRVRAVTWPTTIGPSNTRPHSTTACGQRARCQSTDLTQTARFPGSLSVFLGHLVEGDTFHSGCGYTEQA